MQYIFLATLVLVSVYAKAVLGGCGCNQKSVMVKDFNVGDMQLDKNDMLKIQGFRAATGNRWPKNTLKYTYHNTFGKELRGPLNQFLKDYEKELGGNCIKFQEVGKSGDGIATVKPGNGCSSNVGYADHAFLGINLHAACVNKRNVKHEFSHMLGFMHEHVRPDRDSYLKVNMENIDERLCGNFFLCKGCETTTTYDYLSIMQYPSSAFSCNEQPTILKKNGDTIPFNTVVTKDDVKKVRDYYKC